MDKIAELRAEIARVEKEDRERVAALVASVVPTFEWSVEWPDEHRVCINCRYDAATLARIAEIKAANPNMSFPTAWTDRERWHGMEHIFAYNKQGQAMIWHGGGGSIILALPGNNRSHFDRPPVIVTEEQDRQLHAREVPAEWMKPW